MFTLVSYKFSKGTGCVLLFIICLQTKFSSRCRGWSDSLASTEPCCLKLRLDTTVEQLSPGAEEPRGISGAPLPVLIKPFLKGQVADVTLAMQMSTVTGLIDLIEDEIMQPPLPMEVCQIF